MTSMYGNRGAMASSTRGSLPGDIIPKGYRQGQLQQFDPQQMKLYNQLYGKVGPESYLSKLANGDEELFNQIEAPALRQFSGQLGGLASRFSGMGQGARKSSGFMNTASSAAANFAQELQSNRHNLTRQAMQDLLGLSDQLLNYRPKERFLIEKQQKQNGAGGWGGLTGAGVGAVGGFFAGGGNPLTALKGAQVGYGVGSAFD